MRTQAGPAARVEMGVAAGHQQPQPADTVQDHAAAAVPQAELTWPAGRHLGHRRGAFGQHLAEGGIGPAHGCAPGATELR